MRTRCGIAAGRPVERCRFLVPSVFLLALLVPTFSARADSNSLTLINLTGGITAYNGSGIVIGQIEGTGVPNTNNVYIQGPVQFTTNLVTGTNYFSDHATEVAGVLIGVSNNVPGVAPGAKVSAVEIETGVPYNQTTQTNTVNAAWFVVTNQNARVINMSDRSISGAGTDGTNFVARSIDRLVSQQDVVFVKSAGNSGPGANTITEPGGAYNIIVVGSVTNAPSGTATNLDSTSSRGPLADGRSKPDIVAPGDGILMPTSPVGPNQNALNTDGGTSFAAPHVAGVAARLLQYGDTLGADAALATDPRIIKAVLLNSATKLPGWTQAGTTVSSGVTVVTHPLDYSQGAGLLNANGSYLQLAAGHQLPTFNDTFTNSTVGLKGWDFGSVSLATTNSYRLTSQAGGTLSITLDWYRDVGAGTNAILGMANLDLYLYNSDDVLFTNMPLLALSASTVDNVEHLYFTNAPSEYYQFGVYYAGYNAQAGPPLASVRYGLAWDFTAVPEPGALLLTGLGITTLWWLRRRT